MAVTMIFGVEKEENYYDRHYDDKAKIYEFKKLKGNEAFKMQHLDIYDEIVIIIFTVFELITHSNGDGRLSYGT
ncbi:CLUMA_CG002103, isoform A [Clunio marinus]|uniref:CLUMA_CG002103, isoform A n=1 Tax=Clunio marinus TaxID=568069 RepID=A0A1J1HLN6_9DIPT|nr:CLUMA_CG002103, isoform A [Clunio marinus]